MRDFLTDLSARVWVERSLFAALGLHLLGLHGLAAAKSWLLKAMAGFCLLASIGVLIQGLKITPAMLGFNPVTIGLLGTLASLAGVWLLVGGRADGEWFLGFGISSLGAAAVLFAAGHRLAAGASVAVSIPTVVVGWWIGGRAATHEPDTVSWIGRNTSWLALASASFALATPLIAWKADAASIVEARPRLRDFVTQPSALLLLSVGAAFSAGAAARILPAIRKDAL